MSSSDLDAGTERQISEQQISQQQISQQQSGRPSRGGEAASGSADPSGANSASVNFEEAALAELEIDGVDYRLDAGRAGTALCISTRVAGTWDWEFRGEARWQANVLRCKTFDREVLSQLSKALSELSSSD